MAMILDKQRFQNGFPYFVSIICCWYTLEWPYRDNKRSQDK